MTDITNMTVDDLLDDLNYEVSKECVVNSVAMQIAKELARRLKEAQNKIVAQQARINELAKLIGQLIDTGGADARLAARVLSKVDDLSALAAHDAEVAAKAKAEAFEEVSGEVLSKAEKFLFMDEQKHVAEALNSVFIELDRKAAEYRARIGK